MSEGQFECIRNFVRLSDSIGTAGQPTAEQFTIVKEVGYQIVVNLALPDLPNALPDEQELVKFQGINYVHIPVA